MQSFATHLNDECLILKAGGQSNPAHEESLIDELLDSMENTLKQRADRGSNGRLSGTRKGCT